MIGPPVQACVGVMFIKIENLLHPPLRRLCEAPRRFGAEVEPLTVRDDELVLKADFKIEAIRTANNAADVLACEACWLCCI